MGTAEIHDESERGDDESERGDDESERGDDKTLHAILYMRRYVATRGKGITCEIWGEVDTVTWR
jgi:hypothetical protein